MMPVHRFQYRTGYPAHMTVPQFEKACDIAHRFNLPHTITVSSPLGFPDEFLIDVGSMVIAVLPDGSSHS
jgi:hypothetical protein